MKAIEFTGGIKRMLAFEKLKFFLSNPGMFSVVVAGSRGSGKHFAIEKAFDFLKISKENEIKILCLQKLNFVSAHDFPCAKKDLDELFQSHISETLVIEDFENLKEENKLLLLEALSTVNGKFGIEKKIDIRILFTSSEKIETLRNEQEATSLLLWDRISQLIIELPSFQEEGSNIQTDFENTWNKMAFENIKQYKELAFLPSLENFKYFLETKKSEFVGGFRDLDKIACLYFNYRIYHYGNERKNDIKIEEKVFADVKLDFSGKTQMKNEEPSVNFIFDFNEVKSTDEKRKHPTLDDYNNQFRIHFRNWLLEKHKTLSKAAYNLGCSIHTLKNYKEGRATKLKRDMKK